MYKDFFQSPQHRPIYEPRRSNFQPVMRLVSEQLKPFDFQLLSLNGQFRLQQNNQHSSSYSQYNISSESSVQINQNYNTRNRLVKPKVTLTRQVDIEMQSSEKQTRNRQCKHKIIANKMYRMIEQLGAVPYQNVAVRLLAYLNQSQFTGQIKEEENIKKRVGEALIILIALGVLKKEGKRIKVQQNGKNVGGSSHVQENKKIRQLKDEIALRQMMLKQKKKMLKKVKEKHIFLKDLIQRNQNHSQLRQGTIKFPFIGIVYKHEKTKIEHSERKLQIHSSRLLKPFADIDSLKYIGSFI